MIEQKLDTNWKREIINGKIISMAPASERHSSVVGNIYWIFRTYLKGKKCKVYSDNLYIYLDKFDFDAINKKTRLIPDVMVVCNTEIINPDSDGIHDAPDLVVEVLSPSTAKNDKTVKKDIYEAISVKEYWIVDAKARSIEIYILKDGKYILDNIYHSYSQGEIETIMSGETEEDKTIIKEFKTSLYDDLVISIEDVFDKMI